MFRRLRTRIIVFFVALIGLVQISAFLLVDSANSTLTCMGPAVVMGFSSAKLRRSNSLPARVAAPKAPGCALS